MASERGTACEASRFKRGGTKSSRVTRDRPAGAALCQPGRRALSTDREMASAD